MLLVLIPQDQIFRLLERHHQPVMLAVLGNVGNPPIAHFGGVGRGLRGDFVGMYRYFPGVDAFNASDGRQKLALPVARHPGQANDFAGPQVEIDVFEPLDPLTVAQANICDLQHLVAGPGRVLGHPQQHPPAHHQLGQRRLVSLGRLKRGHQLAAPHDRDIVGHRHDFAQLVGD